MSTLPLPHSPSLPLASLPPTPRDFEIHRLALVEFLSTRRIAEKYGISQTRVRQIIARVSDWLTEMLPVKSEQDIEKEKRYAILLAAAQLQHQIQELKNYWDGSGDPKYLRQQTRAITALARLGASSTTLDSLAATCNRHTPCAVDHVAGFQPATSDVTESGAGFQPAKSDTEPQPDPPQPPTSAFSSPPPPLTPSPPPSDHRPLTSDLSASFPPQEACSPDSPSSSVLNPSSFDDSAANSAPENDLLLKPEIALDTLKGLDIMEGNLLTYIGQIDPKETDRLHRLNESLADLRQSRANFILRLGPNSPVVLPTTTSPQLSSPPPVAST